MTGKVAVVEKGISRSNGTPGYGRAGKQLADRPSKDGTAQKAAQEVEGLKGYVSIRFPALPFLPVVTRLTWLSRSNWGTVLGKERLGPYIVPFIGGLERPLLLSKSSSRTYQRVN
jgi:hypothetical protein